VSRVRILAAILAMLAGCALAEQPGLRDVARLTEPRTGKRIHWRANSQADRDVDAAIRDLLARELSADAAVQVALFNNRNLQATYEELGISQSEVVQAGLLSNPSVDGAVRFSAFPPALPGFELSVGQNVLSLLLMPLRASLAEQQFSQAKLRVGQEVLRLAAQTEMAFYDVVAAAAAVETRRGIAIAAETAAEIAQRQLQAGTTNSLDVALELAMSRELRVALSNAELDAAHARERLNRLMGVWGGQTGWTAQSALPDVPDAQPHLETLETLAVSTRLDLGIGRRCTAPWHTADVSQQEPQSHADTPCRRGHRRASASGTSALGLAHGPARRVPRPA